MPRLLISGGAGFLGSHLCDNFLDRGWSVVAADNLLTGSLQNIAHRVGHSNFTFVEGRCEDLTLDKIGPQPIDAVFHFASAASPDQYLKYPLETLSVGSQGTLRMLELACEHQATFVMASTSEVYGDPDVHPQPESYWGHVNPIGERSVYDEAKRFSEALVTAYHRTKGLSVRLPRIFNTYGPRMSGSDGRVIPNFITQALASQPLTVYGTGQQTRSFCFYRDLVAGLVALLERGDASPVNLGNPHEFTMLELVEVVRELTGTASQVTFKPLPSDDPQRRRPDISRAWRVLEWEPLIDLRQGLKETIDWYRNSMVASEVGR